MSVKFIVIRFAAPLACAIALLGASMPAPAAETPCKNSTAATAQMQRMRIALQNAEGRRVEIAAWIADDNRERAGGYQYICPHIIDAGAILFWYPQPVAGAFHMRNVTAPLDIGFFDENGALFQVQLMHPYTDDEQRTYAPMRKFQYALEARRGFFETHALRAGQSRLLSPVP